MEGLLIEDVLIFMGSMLFNIIQLICIVLTAVGAYYIFEKAGKDGWRALIPFYNNYVLLEILGYNPWLFLILFIPIVNIVFSIFINYKLAKAFGKGILMTIGLSLLPFIFYPYLGLSDENVLIIK